MQPSETAVRAMQAESEVIVAGESLVDGFSGNHVFYTPAPPRVG